MTKDNGPTLFSLDVLGFLALGWVVIHWQAFWSAVQNTIQLAAR